MGAFHSTYRPETMSGRAIFIAPTKLRGFDIVPFNRALARKLTFYHSKNGLDKVVY